MSLTEHFEELLKIVLNNNNLDDNEFGLVIKEFLKSKKLNDMLNVNNFDSIVKESFIIVQRDKLYNLFGNFYRDSLTEIIDKFLDHEDLSNYCQTALGHFSEVVLKKINSLCINNDNLSIGNFMEVLSINEKAFEDFVNILVKKKSTLNKALKKMIMKRKL